MSIKQQINPIAKQIDAIEQQKSELAYQQKELFVHNFADFLDSYPNIEQNYHRIEMTIAKNYNNDEPFLNEVICENLDITFYDHNVYKTQTQKQDEQFKKAIHQFLNIWQEKNSTIKEFINNDLSINFDQCHNQYKDYMVNQIPENKPSHKSTKKLKVKNTNQNI